ncbi:MAG TPA: XdhC/CoxI family protein [Acidimicrobiales bacterium]|nr:XdhC/CoxI family protein [Acidimicrobiales bacterium]
MSPGAPGPAGLFETLRRALRESRPVALATVTSVDDAVVATAVGSKVLVLPGGSGQGAGGESVEGVAAGESGAASVIGSLGDPDLDRVVTRDVLAAIASGLTVTRHYGPHGEARQMEVEVFIEVFAPPPRMIIFGAVDFTAALASAGKLLGYHVVVCDARAVFATPERFPMADEVVVEWPDRYLERVGADLGPRDAVCVLTHDTKFDVPAVLAALRTGVGYLGAMGSRRTHDERRKRLIDAGADPAELANRLMSPIGLDIGARTPEETAIAICAEIIASRTGIAVPSLRRGEGPIHPR